MMTRALRRKNVYRHVALRSTEAAKQWQPSNYYAVFAAGLSQGTTSSEA